MSNFVPLRYIVSGILLFSHVASASTLAAQEPEENSQVKNVLMIVSDDLKASVLGCYGDPQCQTPNIDQLAAEGMVFERAYCQGVVCGPSRRSFMFSRYQGKAPVNLGQHLREQGMYTARVGKIYHMRVPGDIIAGTNGEDEASSWTERFNAAGLEAHTPGDYACLNLNQFTSALENRESTQTKNRMFVTVQYDGDSTLQADFKATSKAIELLESHRDQPFFLALGLVRPHYPMVAPRKYFEMHPWQQVNLPEYPEDDYSDIPKIGLAGTKNSTNPIGKYPDNQKRMWSGYYASVAFMDAQVGRILARLEELGLKDSTAIVFISDHGYHLGEHGFWQKSNLHEEAIRVPMIIRAPGLGPGRSRSFVELIDIFPTISDLLGWHVPASVQGKSLVPILKNPAISIRDTALSINKGYSLRAEGWHYMRYSNGEEELYDLVQDPGEYTNLIGNSEHASQRESLQAKLKNRLKVAGLK